MLTPNQLADAVLIIHAVYVGVVVLSVPLIMAGGWLRWRWVRNVWFRATHLLMILIVVVESFLGITCPLTVWERAFRPATAAYEDPDFIATGLDRLLFHHFPHWVFAAIYVGFGAVVLGLFFFVPVERRRKLTPPVP